MGGPHAKCPTVLLCIIFEVDRAPLLVIILRLGNRKLVFKSTSVFEFWDAIGQFEVFHSQLRNGRCHFGVAVP